MEVWKKRFRRKKGEDNSGLAFHEAKLKVTLGGVSATSDKLLNNKDKKTRPLDGFE